MEDLSDVNNEQYEVYSSSEEEAIVEDADNIKIEKSLTATETEDNDITSKMIEDGALQVDDRRVASINAEQSDIDREDTVVFSENEEDEKSIDPDMPNNTEADGKESVDDDSQVIAVPAENAVIEAVSEMKIDISNDCNGNDCNETDANSIQESVPKEPTCKSTDDSFESKEQNNILHCKTSPQQKLVRTKGKRDLLQESMGRESRSALKTKHRSSENKSMTMPRPMTERSSLFAEAKEEPRHATLLTQELSRTPENKEARVDDLLANFVEYKDQIPPTPSERPKTSIKENKHRPMSATKGRQPWPISESKTTRASTSPLIKPMRQLGADKRKSLPRPKKLSERKSYDPIDYDIPASLTKRMSVMSPKTPESQRSHRKVGLNKNHSIHELCKEKPRSRITDLQSIAVRILSTAVKIFCVTCIIARCLTFVGGKRSFLRYLVETPTVWIVRFYILIFHAVLILVEMRVSIPGLLPEGTLNNFVHRAFVQSFIGLIDILMNSNRTLVEHDGTLDSDVDRWIDLSYAVLRVSPRGLLFCAIFYFMLAVCGKDGRSNFHRRFYATPNHFNA